MWLVWGWEKEERGGGVEDDNRRSCSMFKEGCMHKASLEVSLKPTLLLFTANANLPFPHLPRKSLCSSISSLAWHTRGKYSNFLDALHAE